MEARIENLVTDYERGRLSRRELVQGLAALAASTVAFAQEAPRTTFQATGLNHIALRVPDLGRSRDFYVKHLGLAVSRESASSCFLTCGDNFVALFRGSEPAMDHYCYAVEDYRVEDAEAKLQEQGLEPRVQGQRIYFDDPDGLEVQLAASGHRA